MTDTLSALSWRQLEPLLDRALELSGTAQDAYLDEVCGDNAALRAELDGLLQADRSADCFLDRQVCVAGSVSAVGTRVGPYQLLEPLGEGGMGRVFLANRVDGEFEQQVAIKFLSVSVDPRAQQHFQAECQNLARLDHPNIVNLMDGGVTESGASYLILQYIEGASIMRFAETNQLGLRARMRLFRQLCDAVTFVHRNLIVHRDLKPSNVLVTSEGQVKLLDFGISRDLAVDATQTNSLMTPRYAAPEQILGQSVTTLTDVYGLGVLLHELLTGLPPFAEAGYSIEALAQRAKLTEPPRPSSTVKAGFAVDAKALRGDLDAMLLKCLQAEPTRRYASVDALRNDTCAWLAGEEISARRPNLVSRSWRAAKRNRWTVAAIATSLSLALGAAGYHVRTVQNERDTAIATTDFFLDLIAGIKPTDGNRDNALKFPVGEFYREGMVALTDSAIVDTERSRLARTFSLGLHSLGDWDAAFAAADEAVALAERAAPQGAAHISAVLQRAAAATNQGQLAKASRDYEWLMDRVGGSIAEDSIDAAAVWSDYAFWLSQGGKPEAVEPFARRALAILDRHPANHFTQSTRSAALTNLTRALALDPARKDEAWELAQELIAVAIEREGAESMVLARAYAIAVSSRGGEPAERERMSRQAFQIAQRVLGPDHSQTLGLMNNYAVLIASMGRVEDAIPLFEQLIEYRSDDPTYETTTLGSNQQNLAAMLRRVGRLEEAQARAEQARQLYAESLPAQHWLHGMPLLILSEIELTRARPEAALTLSEQAVDFMAPLQSANLAKRAAVAIRAIAVTDMNRCVPSAMSFEDGLGESLSSDLPADHALREHLPRLEGVMSCP